MEALNFLENAVTDKSILDEMISAFEKMCEIPIECEEEYFFDYIKNSQEYLTLKNTKFANVDIFEDET